MQKVVSTNIHLPEELWKEVKIQAAKQGKTMREIIVDGICLVLGKKSPLKKSASAGKFLLSFSGKGISNITDGSVNHDHYIYD